LRLPGDSAAAAPQQPGHRTRNSGNCCASDRLDLASRQLYAGGIWIKSAFGRLGYALERQSKESSSASIRPIRCHMRLLVVEDEPELRAVIARALREEGYAVDEAGDGEEGLFKANAWTYDAIVLDLMLPRVDGFEVLKQLRREKSVPVLILTARDAVTDRVRGLDTGGDDYLVKPFDLAELFARLRALVRRAKGQARAAIAIGEVVIDTRSRKVTRSGKPVSLTAREYSLVELLAMHRGALVTRTEIYDHLFDETSDTLSNLVEVHVANIRRKLGKEFIQTRRGQGYIIDD
jgi:DNA-binding response OmpR family regulator